MTSSPRPRSDAAEVHQSLFEQSPDGLLEIDRDGHVLASNARVAELLHVPAAALHAAAYDTLVHADSRQQVQDELARSLDGERRQFRTRARTAEGGRLVLDVTTVPIVKDGQITSVFAILRDVTDEVAAQAALAESEQRHRRLFEASGAGIAITNLDGRYVDANRSFCAMLDYSVAELTEQTFLDLTHPDDRGGNRDLMDELLSGEVPSAKLEKRYLHRSGHAVWVRAQVAVIRDTDGTPLHVTTTTEDITEERATRERLQRSEQLRRLAGDMARVGGWSVDAATRTLYWSQEVFRILDLPVRDAPSMTEGFGEYPAIHRRRVSDALNACLDDGTPFDLTFELNTAKRTNVPYRLIGEAERDDDGRIVRVNGTMQDVTELVAATRRAQDAAQRLAQTLESMADAVYILDRHWVFIYLNQQAGQLLQRDPNDLIGQTIWDAFPDTVGTAMEETYRRAMQRNEPQSLDELFYPPLATWFAVDAYPTDQGLAVYFRDVTQTHAARAALQRQATLLDLAQDAIIVRDLDHRVTYWNASAERIYGWSTSEAVGQDIRDLLNHDPGVYDSAMEELRTSGSWSGEIAKRNRAGQDRIIAARWTLIEDDMGPDLVLAIDDDITERTRTEQQMLRAQRLESLGTLASGIAHDLNNTLAPILLATELLTTRDMTTDQRELLDTIQTSARRSADLVEQVLLFARGGEGNRVPIDVQSLLHDVRIIVKDTFPRSVRLTTEVPEGLATVLGDSTQLQQVVLNLAVNARDAMPDGGELTITADRVTLDAQYAASHPDALPGDYVRIVVEDTGIGMTQDTYDRLFEPFFTTKAPGAGTGLGLPTSAGIVRSHGGFMQVYSEVDLGTRFHVYLPVTAESAEALAEPVPPDAAPRGNGELILVVDDEDHVRAMTRQTLHAHGYEVLEAANGAEAISVYAEHRDQVDLVMTDMMMPIMDGPATIRALLRLDPGLRIVGASGLHTSGATAQAQAAGVEHFLPKPFNSLQLLEIIADALDAA